MVAEIGILIALYASVRMVDVLMTHAGRKGTAPFGLLAVGAVVVWLFSALVVVDLFFRGTSGTP